MEKIYTPFEIYKNMINSSVEKAKKPFLTNFLLGIMAGIFIALAAIGAISIWGMEGDIALKKFLGAAVFPVGIFFVVVAGSQLFTGNALMTTAVFKKKLSIASLLKNWSAVYLGNLVGSVFIAFLAYEAGLYEHTSDLNSMGKFVVAVGLSKTALSFKLAFFKGVLCNILVVLAVWSSTSTKTMIGKVSALWLPVTVFALSGYEHCVANMFFIPMAMFLRPSITVLDLFHNLVPVTLGNIVGGGLVVPIMYYLIYLKNKTE